MAERLPLVVISGQVQQLPEGDTVAGALSPLKIIYNNENLQIETNTQVTGHHEISFTGTGELIILGTGSLGVL